MTIALVIALFCSFAAGLFFGALLARQPARLARLTRERDEAVGILRARIRRHSRMAEKN